MSRLIDISVTITPETPVWPGSESFTIIRNHSIKHGDSANVSSLCCDVHCGTHIDAPLHFIDDGMAVDSISPDLLVGSCTVVSFEGYERITSKDLEAHCPETGMVRLLLKTDNSRFWTTKAGFQKQFCALDVDAAHWLVKKGIRLVGIDYLSIAPYGNGQNIHKILLRGGVLIVESLDLSNVVPGQYELICLPLKLAGAEGAPARALLRRWPHVQNI